MDEDFEIDSHDSIFYNKLGKYQGHKSIFKKLGFETKGRFYINKKT